MSNALFGSSRIVGIAAAYANQVRRRDYNPGITAAIFCSLQLLSARIKSHDHTYTDRP